MGNTLLKEKYTCDESEAGSCMYCGRPYSLKKRVSEITNPESRNSLGCCSDRCLALEDALQETS